MPNASIPGSGKSGQGRFTTPTKKPTEGVKRNLQWVCGSVLWRGRNHNTGKDVRKAVGAETTSQTMFTTGWGSYHVANNLADGGADRSAIDDYYDDLLRKVKGGCREKAKRRKYLPTQTLAPFFGLSEPLRCDFFHGNRRIRATNTTGRRVNPEALSPPMFESAAYYSAC